MKILFWQWNSFMGKGVERAMHNLDIAYDTFFFQLDNWEQDDRFAQELENKILNGEYMAVFSVNYSPIISEVCQNCGLRYIAWVYDSPIHIRDISLLNNSCNSIYFFDRGQVEAYKADNITAQYLPLAADVESFAVGAAGGSQNYRTDISLVGQLYQTEYQHYMEPLTTYQRGYLEGIIASQKKIYGGYILHDLITDQLLNELNVEYDRASKGTVKIEERELEFMLAREITSRERYEALALLSNHYRVDLYSTDFDSRLTNVNKLGYVDYYTKMPQVFRTSKINLNISLKTIRTGIPLRVLDVLACGGFLLSNYQEELAEYFRVGEELVTYSDIEEMYYQVQYYLEHEDERKLIAARGLQRVKGDFRFEDRLRTMFAELQ